MKRILYFLLVTMVLTACSSNEESDEMPPEEKWADRIATISAKDSLIEGTTYLSVYSHIFSISELRRHDLTVTISLRNTSKIERVFIKSAEYFNTDGRLVKSYLEQPIFINPMETAEIMIFEKDIKGGTGGNFIFDWATANKNNKPFFEAVMISTIGQQGLSFSTQGVELIK
jgi:hypothetical protein